MKRGQFLLLGDRTVVMLATLGAGLTAGCFRVVALLLSNCLGLFRDRVFPRVPATRRILNDAPGDAAWAVLGRPGVGDAVGLIARNQQLRRRAQCLCP
jgi:hypothetical protein